MLFYIFTIIVLIAELILTFSALLFLFKLNKKIIQWNIFLNEAKPKIKDIAEICKKISEQCIDFATLFVQKSKSFFINLLLGQVKNILGSIIFFAVKNEVEKHVH